MSEREYVKELVDIIPEEKLGDVIEYMMNISDGASEEEKFRIVSEHILEKYRKAFEELAK